MRNRGSGWIGLLVLVALAFVASRTCGGSGDDEASGTAAGATPVSAATTSATTATSTTAPVTRRGLLEALAAGLVQADFRSLGGASGDVVALDIRRLGDPEGPTLEITIPTGLMLANPAGGEQDLVVAGLEGRMTGASTYEPATEIALDDDSLYTYLLEAYCAEAHDANPSDGGALNPADLAGRDLVAALGAVSGAGASGETLVIQAVVWAITDDVTPADLQAVGYGLDEEDLALARRIMEAAGLDPGSYRLFGG